MPSKSLSWSILTDYNEVCATSKATKYSMIRWSVARIVVDPAGPNRTDENAAETMNIQICKIIWHQINVKFPNPVDFVNADCSRING